MGQKSIDEALADWAKRMQKKVQEVNTSVDNGLLKAAYFCEGQAKKNAMLRIYNLPIDQRYVRKNFRVAVKGMYKTYYKRTGLYKGSIGAKMNPNTPHSAILYNSAPYAKYLEFGTSKGIRGKYIMSDAVLKHQAEIIKIISNYIKNGGNKNG
ncbi:hypothetical protein KYB31_09135 [Clostridium felsineum]|uniref:hypothetical protein n=1 Tax=Clostridium felsineum TaxID=36839 RepID=UPI00214DCCF5|nr:hypothetical protein [Clostridium felsineum]MCR3759152.1 hypothetical protein [Clostridium felsineum]